MLVRVYWNLHKNLFSIQHIVHGKGWRVRDHSTEVYLEGCTLPVYPAAYQRTLCTGHRNVHAFVQGNIRDWCPNNLNRVLRYDMAGGGFRDRDTLEKVGYAAWMKLTVLGNGRPLMEYIP